jgi:hypothetical protein
MIKRAASAMAAGPPHFPEVSVGKVLKSGSSCSLRRPA